MCGFRNDLMQESPSLYQPSWIQIQEFRKLARHGEKLSSENPDLTQAQTLGPDNSLFLLTPTCTVGISLYFLPTLKTIFINFWEFQYFFPPVLIFKEDSYVTLSRISL